MEARVRGLEEVVETQQGTIEELRSLAASRGDEGWYVTDLTLPALVDSALRGIEFMFGISRAIIPRGLAEELREGVKAVYPVLRVSLLSDGVTKHGRRGGLDPRFVRIKLPLVAMDVLETLALPAPRAVRERLLGPVGPKQEDSCADQRDQADGDGAVRGPGAQAGDAKASEPARVDGEVSELPGDDPGEAEERGVDPAGSGVGVSAKGVSEAQAVPAWTVEPASAGEPAEAAGDTSAGAGLEVVATDLVEKSNRDQG